MKRTIAIQLLSSRLIALAALLIGSLLPCQTFAQATVTFEASTDARQVVLGGYFEVTFTLANANGTNFQPPPFTNFSLLSGPSQATSVSSVNGRWSRTMSFSYVLQPRKVGKFTIGPASIVADGKNLRTKAVSVEVVKGKSSNARTQKDLLAQIEEQIFIRAEPSTDAAFIGEQILLDYKLYTSREIETYNLVAESDYAGFFAQDIRRFNARVIREVINGVQYSTKILKRVALFPQQAGTLTIDPMVMQLAVLAEGQTQRRGFFYSPKVNRLQVKTAPVSITIRSLPDGAPPSFTGAVGKFKMSTVVNRSTLSTDDAITLTMTLSGNSDIKRVLPPPLDAPASFELYEPRMVEDRSYEDNRGFVNGNKVVEYILLPKEPGVHRLTPRFTYYDTDSLKYITIQPQTYTFNVQQGNRQASAANTTVPKAGATKELRYILTDTSFRKKESTFFGSALFWLLSLFPLVVLLGAVVVKQVKARKGEVDIVLLKRLQAQRVAQKRLKQASQHLQANDSRAFYDEVSRALFGYVCDKLNIPLSQLSKQNVQQRLQSLQVSQHFIDQFAKVIQTCEMALFAGMDNSAAMQSTYDQTLELVTNIEEEIG